MKLDDAIEQAFGCSDSVRRDVWPRGSGGRINYELDCSLTKFEWIRFTFGHRDIVTITTDDLEADDWQPCTIGARPAPENWSKWLCVGSGDEERCLLRGQQCRVMLDHMLLPGNWKLAWVVPNLISMAVTLDGAGRWPEIKEGMFIPLGRLLLSAESIDLVFHLLQSSYWQPAENIRLYQFTVVRMDE